MNPATAHGPSDLAGAAAQPEVSVLMPLNRHHAYLHEAVTSVLTQTGVNLELLILINGPDRTLADRVRAQYTDPRVRVLDTPVPGLPFSLNLGLSMSRADLIARMDSDDVCEPHRLMTQASHMRRDPALTVIGSRLTVIDEHHRVQRLSRWKTRSRETLKKSLALRCILPHPSVMFRKADVLSVGGYAYGSVSEDYDLWLRLRRNPASQFELLETPLLRYRVHSEQVTSGKRAWEFLAFNSALKWRELLLTGDWRYVAGIAMALAEYIYIKFNRQR